MDPSNGNLYVASGGVPSTGIDGVANTGPEEVTVINAATGSAVASVPVGASPDAIAYDSANGYLYVTNSFSNNTTVIDGGTNTVVASIPVGSAPDGIAVDPINNTLFSRQLWVK